MIDAAQHMGLVWAFVRRQKFPPLDEDEVLGVGSLALVRAAQNYDPARGSFANHAMPRIKYAILDEQRRLIGRRGNRPPMVSLDALREAHPTWDVAGADVVLPAQPIDIDAVTRDLPETWRRIIRWYYVDRERQRVIAGRLGVSEKRVSQVRLKALKRLRSLPQFA